MTGLLREPLLHFFLFGAAIFGLFVLFDDGPPVVSANILEVTEDEARRLAAEFEATWRRPPTPVELEQMITQFVREEVYVREALALGLDRDDAVIRRRLQTKMEFLSESGAEAVQPKDTVLQAHLETNADRFSLSELVAFEQILLNETVDGEQVKQVLAGLNSGSGPGAAARPTLLPPVFRASPAQVVDATFGRGFFGALGALPLDNWSGPVETSLGRHLVRVTERRAARLPALNEIRDRVEQDWRVAFTQQLRKDRFEALLGRYDVIRPDPALVLSR